jgi:hypothetical protein
MQTDKCFFWVHPEWLNKYSELELKNWHRFTPVSFCLLSNIANIGQWTVVLHDNKYLYPIYPHAAWLNIICLFTVSWLISWNKNDFWITVRRWLLSVSLIYHNGQTVSCWVKPTLNLTLKPSNTEQPVYLVCYSHHNIDLVLIIFAHIWKSAQTIVPLWLEILNAPGKLS